MEQPRINNVTRPLGDLFTVYPSLLAALLQANYTIFPDEAGVPYLIKLDLTPLTVNELEILKGNVNTITFTLFTRENPKDGQLLSINNVQSVEVSNWKPYRPTMLVTHGWTSSGTSKSCTLIRDAYIKALDCNVIIIDWSVIAKNLIYSQVAKSVPSVGKHVAEFSNFMRSKLDLRASYTTMVGHSLGAHVMGLAARTLISTGIVAQLLGLDPAKPLFENKGPDGRIDRSQAKNVQIIHTAAGKLGMDTAVGMSDFYCNGGSNQPGCHNDLLGACAHSRSYEYFSVSITDPKGFPGVSTIGRPNAYMGGVTFDPSAKGPYNVKTLSQPPYAPGG
ncbi:pancreatic lipase-related protein 2 [Ptiloglossa arizonensis]|uniref:pancreatic lipase-related protein 2 n=1 Tax=Ptiloglossa arizonensis TaxID=3350558 RepID=UPI003FA06B3B